MVESSSACGGERRFAGRDECRGEVDADEVDMLLASEGVVSEKIKRVV